MKKNKTIYVISGLGADKDAFSKLDFAPFEPQFITWITPRKNESLTQYARRIIQEQIHEHQPYICGLSFGLPFGHK